MFYILLFYMFICLYVLRAYEVLIYKGLCNLTITKMVLTITKMVLTITKMVLTITKMVLLL